MNPTRLFLTWLGVLLALDVLLGAARAYGLEVAASLQAIAWGLLLALLLLAMLDAFRLRRLPSPLLRRQLPGSLPLGRWSEVRLEVRHDFTQPLTL